MSYFKLCSIKIGSLKMRIFEPSRIFIYIKFCSFKFSAIFEFCIREISAIKYDAS